MGQEDPGPFYLSTRRISEGLWSRRSGAAAWMGGGRGSSDPLRPRERSLGSLAPSCKPADHARLRVWGPALQCLFRQCLGRVSHAPELCPVLQDLCPQPAARAFPTAELSCFQDKCPQVYIFSINVDLYFEFQIEKKKTSHEFQVLLHEMVYLHSLPLHVTRGILSDSGCDVLKWMGR